MLKTICSLFILLLFVADVNGQGETGLPYLALQQSILFTGAGNIGAAIPMQDPSGFYYNPAQLGYFSRKNNFAVSFLPEKNKWIPRSGMDYSFQSFTVAAGYNFGNNNKNLPLSIGIGYIHNQLNFGQYLRLTPYSPDGYLSKEDYDAFDCFSIGVGYESFLQYQIGFSIKSFESIFGDQPTQPGIGPAEARGSAYDFGVMITAPLSELFFKEFQYDFSSYLFIKPKTEVTIGYSVTNIGKEIYYLEPEKADPIPRTARLGYTLNFGIDLFVRENKINAIDYSFTAEAEDILVKKDLWYYGKEYQGILGDINVVKHLFELRDDENVVVHKGHILRLFETFIISSGVYDGRWLNHIKTNGLGFSSEGILKLLDKLMDNRIVSFIANHFMLEYYSTNTFVDSWKATNLRGISIFFKGIEF